VKKTAAFMESTQTVSRTDVSISYVRPESHQLFFLFVGIWNKVTIHTLEFVRATAIGDRNLVILKDPHYGQCYQKGISDEYDSLDGIARWQEEELRQRFPHVTEVFCVGTSAGGGPAIHTACRIGARAAWSLGGRIVRPEIADERDRVAKAIYRRVIGRSTLDGLTDDEHTRLMEELHAPETRQLRWDLIGNPATVVAHDRVQALVARVRERATPVALHFYYATTNIIDREFACAFRECAGVTLHPIVPPPHDWSRDVTFRDPDHGIVPMLHEMGRLGELFSAYV
jgi:hypothetical protein